MILPSSDLSILALNASTACPTSPPISNPVMDVNPPSTASDCPVIWDAPSEAKKILPAQYLWACQHALGELKFHTAHVSFLRTRHSVPEKHRKRCLYLDTSSAASHDSDLIKQRWHPTLLLFSLILNFAYHISKINIKVDCTAIQPNNALIPSGK